MKTKKMTLLSLVFLAACAHKQVKQDSATTSATAASQPAVATGADGQAVTTSGSCSDDIQCPDKHLCVSGHCVAIHPGMAECALVRVHFDFGDAALKAPEYPAMARMARCLKADHGMKLDIAGNADERGTEEYNLALGDKRARAVARYLENLGVSEGQLNTVSFGKERPLCTEHNEDCWQQNRRARLAPK